MLAVMVIKWLILLVRDNDFADNLVKSALSQLYFSKKILQTYFILFNGDRIFKP